MHLLNNYDMLPTEKWKAVINGNAAGRQMSETSDTVGKTGGK